MGARSDQLGTLQSNGISEIRGRSSVVNSGTVEPESGSLKIDPSLPEAGTLQIDTGTISVDAQGRTASFTSTMGMLKLAKPKHLMA